MVKLVLRLALLTALQLSTNQILAAEVISVGDGDTITVTHENKRIKIRLACIDAPETAQMPFGNAARQRLLKLLPAATEVSIKSKAVDRYGRTVAEVFKDNTNINQKMVATGDAFIYWQYISGCDRQTYSRLENNARLNSLGVWSVGGGIQRPWLFRR